MNIKTPAYVIEENLLERNLKILDRVQKEAGCKVLVALKGMLHGLRSICLRSI